MRTCACFRIVPVFVLHACTAADAALLPPCLLNPCARLPPPHAAREASTANPISSTCPDHRCLLHRRRALAVYPVLLMYTSIGWLALVKS